MNFFSLIVFAVMTGAVIVLLTRWYGGGGGGNDRAFPSTEPNNGAGGWIPGSTLTGYRNGGVGATQPQVWSN